MCYSSRIEAEYRKYVKAFGAELSLRDYVKLFWERRNNPKIKTPKAMEAEFREPNNDAEREIKTAIDEFTAAEKNRIEAELFKQRKRLNDANRALESKTTKAASESKRIAGEKIQWASAKLDDLRRSEPLERDSRIFPGYYAPLLIMENGQLTVKPMRYQCRVAGKPASYDVKYPGTYNARRDSLEKYWKELFGYTHGILAMSAFYENLDRHRVEGRELKPGEKAENIVLEFEPNPPHTMYAACLWSHWTGQGNEKGEADLYSFALITDEPPPEIAVAGYDRCIIPIKPEHVAAWLNPDPRNLAAQYAILDDRERPYYEHRLAA